MPARSRGRRSLHTSVLIEGYTAVVMEATAGQTKLPYEPPRLTVHGDIRALTLHHAPGHMDVPPDWVPGLPPFIFSD